MNVGLADVALAANANSKALPPSAADAVAAFPVKSPVTLPVTSPVTLPVKSPVNVPAIAPVPVIVGDVSVLLVNVCVSVN